MEAQRSELSEERKRSIPLSPRTKAPFTDEEKNAENEGQRSWSTSRSRRLIAFRDRDYGPRSGPPDQGMVEVLYEPTEPNNTSNGFVKGPRSGPPSIGYLISSSHLIRVIRNWSKNVFDR